jgi:hypothetical protein
VSFSRS